MKKFLKSRMFAFVLGAIIFGSIGVLATTVITADQIEYKNSTVEAALNDIYDVISESSMQLVKSCSSSSNNCSMDLTVGKVYLCIVNTTKGYNSANSITGAEILFKQEVPTVLDYNYSNYRYLIKATSSSVNFQVDTSTRVAAACYSIINNK